MVMLFSLTFRRSAATSSRRFLSLAAAMRDAFPPMTTVLEATVGPVSLCLLVSGRASLNQVRGTPRTEAATCITPVTAPVPNSVSPVPRVTIPSLPISRRTAP